MEENLFSTDKVINQVETNLKCLPLRKMLPDGFLKEIDSNFRQFCRGIRDNLRKDNYEIIGVTGYPGCQPKGNKVLMANGEWKNIEDIKIGDEVLSPQHNGSNIYSKVTNITSWYCNETYEVSELNRSHNKLYSCSNNHLIPLYCKRFPRIKNGKNNGRDYINNKIWKIQHYTAQDFSKISIHSKNRLKITFSSFNIDNFKDRSNCKIEPYSLGVILGDGSFTKDLNITSNDYEILQEISKFYPIMSFRYKKDTTCKQYNFSIKGELSKQLESYGLRYKRSGDKFIPKEALLSDSNYRKRLLAGLIDTDGHYSNGSYQFTLKSKRLIEDIKNLTYSLGGKSSVIRRVKKSIKSTGFIGEYYSINIYFNNLCIPLQVKRKIKNIKCGYLASNRLAIDCKKSSGKVVYGFELDSPSKWYITDNWMITHNTGKSQLVAIMGCLIDENYSFDKNINFIPTSTEIEKDYLKLPMYSFLHIDEASRSIHKHKWYEKTQQKLSTLYDTEREGHYLCSVLIMPRFQNFTENFRNFFIKYWINVICRGLAIVYKRDEDKDTKDPWNVDFNMKLKQKYWKGKRIFERSVSDIIRMEQKTKNYWFYFKIPEIPKETWAVYQKLKSDSRVTMRESEANLETASYKERVNMIKMDRWKRIVELRNENKTYEQIAVVLNVSSATIRKSMREIEAYQSLKGDVYGAKLCSKDTINNIYNQVKEDENKVSPSEFNIP